MTQKSYDVTTTSPINDDKSKRPLLNQSNSPNGTNSISSPNTSDKSNIVDQVEETYVQIVHRHSPRDRFYFVYLIFLLFGLANMMPWNIFITAEDYFVKYKLNTNTSANATYTNKFIFYVGITGQCTNVLMNLFNTFVTIAGNPRTKIPFTIVLSAVVLVFHVILAIVDSSTWPFVFFILCLVSVIFMYIANGILQSCVFNLVTIFPMEYTNAIVLGNNLSGVYCSAMSIISKATSPDLRIAAIYYFLSAFVIVMIAFVCNFAMRRTKYYRYWSSYDEDNKAMRLRQQNNKVVKVPYLKIIKKIWPLLFSIWLNFFSCLAIFPVFQLGIKPVSSTFFIPEKWFQDFVTFLTFNVFVTIGNLIPKIVKLPGPKFLPIAVVLRAVFSFAFFMLSNYKPEERNIFPVIVQNDFVYWFGAIVLALLFGHFTSLLMMNTPKQVEPEYAGTAGMLSALSLVIGVVTGLQFSQILELIVLI